MKYTFPKQKIQTVLLENIDRAAVDLFTTEGYPTDHHTGSYEGEQLNTTIKHAKILCIRSRTKLTAEVLAKLPHLLAIGAYCIGTDQIDLAAAAERGIAVFNAPYSNTRSVVELVLGQIIMLSRRIPEKNQKAQQGIWDKSVKNCHEIRGKTLGIIGYGNIGAQLSVLAEALGMRVLFYDTAEKLALGNVQSVSLKDLLVHADVVTVHVDGNRKNANLIGAQQFSQMKQGALFINASRGFVVNLPDLADALKSGHLLGAAVDVFPQEPKKKEDAFKSVLQGIPNVILTPHIGGNTVEAQRNIATFVSNKLVQFINTGDTSLSVNLPPISLSPQQNTHRLLHLHRNVPGVLARLNRLLAQHKANIEGQYLKTTEQIGYTITDINKTYSRALEQQLKTIPGTIRSRILY